MSDTKTLTAEQSLIFRDLETALENFGKTKLTDGFAIAKSLGDIANVKMRLREAFPELAAKAKVYYFDDLADNPELDSDGYEDALFDLMLSLIQLEKAETFDEFTTPLHNMSSELYDMKTFSPEFDVERGHWKD